MHVRERLRERTRRRREVELVTRDVGPRYRLISPVASSARAAFGGSVPRERSTQSAERRGRRTGRQPMEMPAGWPAVRVGPSLLSRAGRSPALLRCTIVAYEVCLDANRRRAQARDPDRCLARTANWPPTNGNAGRGAGGPGRAVPSFQSRAEPCAPALHDRRVRHVCLDANRRRAQARDPDRCLASARRKAPSAAEGGRAANQWKMPAGRPAVRVGPSLLSRAGPSPALLRCTIVAYDTCASTPTGAARRLGTSIGASRALDAKRRARRTADWPPTNGNAGRVAGGPGRAVPSFQSRAEPALLRCTIVAYDTCASTPTGAARRLGTPIGASRAKADPAGNAECALTAGRPPARGRGGARGVRRASPRAGSRARRRRGSGGCRRRRS